MNFLSLHEHMLDHIFSMKKIYEFFFLCDLHHSWRLIHQVMF
ncbi:hypothetical protein [Klebsiella pneumoniae ISC21]|nr:hypothetical protein [Klebsiella pneumoniae ISC21]